MHIQRRVVGLTVQAPRAEGIPVQVRRAATLAHMLIAAVYDGSHNKRTLIIKNNINNNNNNNYNYNDNNEIIRTIIITIIEERCY
jgi:hypothetical protein